MMTDKNKVMNTKLWFLLKANFTVHKEDGLNDFHLNHYTARCLEVFHFTFLGCLGRYWLNSDWLPRNSRSTGGLTFTHFPP